MKPILCLALALAASSALAQAPSYKVVGDGIPQSLTGKPGNAAAGRALLVKREAANCLQCHAVKKDKDLAGGGDGPPLSAEQVEDVVAYLSTLKSK